MELITLIDYEKFRDNNILNDDSYKKLITKINRIGDKYWLIELASGQKNTAIFNWHTIYDPNNLEIITLGQELALSYIGDYSNPDTGRIVASSKSVWDTAKSMHYLLNKISVDYEVKNFHRITSEYISSKLIEIVKDVRKSSEEKHILKDCSGYRKAADLHGFIKKMSSQPLKMISPFSKVLPIELADLSMISDSYLKEIGLTYSDWNESKHHESIPFSILLSWVAYILEEFE